MVSLTDLRTGNGSKACSPQSPGLGSIRKETGRMREMEKDSMRQGTGAMLSQEPQTTSRSLRFEVESFQAKLGNMVGKKVLGRYSRFPYLRLSSQVP